MTIMILVSIVLLLLTAFLAAGIFVTHQRWMTFIALAGILFESEWMLLSLIRRTLLPDIPMDTVFIGGALVLAVVAAISFRYFALPADSETTPYTREFVVAFITFIVLTASIVVWRYNGYDGQGTWVMHGFFNGDTVTLSALIERSLNTNTLVTQNPFAANGYLEYPTVLHGALADFIQATGIHQMWQEYLPLITYIQILITVPMFFLLWDVVFPEPAKKEKPWLGTNSRRLMYWLQAGITLWVLAIAWDNYIYPQSHFFLTGMFVGLAALLVHAFPAQGLKQIPYVCVTAALALLLLLSNAVTGTAAIALVVTWYLLRASDIGRATQERISFGAGVVLAMAAFFIFSSGDASLGRPQFSYTAASDMLRLGIPVGFLVVAIFSQVKKMRFLAVTAGVLSVLSFIVFFFSTRDIVVGNASRFFYHAVLIGFVLFLPLLIRVSKLTAQRVSAAKKDIPEAATLLVITGVAGLFISLPALASVASAHDNLMFQDERAVYFGTLRAMEWIKNNTEPDAVIVATPNPPWSIPFFTGRSLVRAEDFWLSPQDQTLKDVKAAFNGREAMQEKLKEEHAYLMLFISDLERWNMQDEEAAFKNINVAIFRLGE